jgi:hypothetical protein
MWLRRPAAGFTASHVASLDGNPARRSAFARPSGVLALRSSEKRKPPLVFVEERGCCDQLRRSLRCMFRSRAPDLCAMRAWALKALTLRPNPPPAREAALVSERGCGGQRRSSWYRAWRTCAPNLCAKRPCAPKRCARAAFLPKNKSPPLVFRRSVAAAAKGVLCAERGVLARPTCAPWRSRSPERCADVAFLQKTKAPLLFLGGTWPRRPDRRGPLPALHMAPLAA